MKIIQIKHPIFPFFEALLSWLELRSGHQQRSQKDVLRSQNIECRDIKNFDKCDYEKL